jgi:hypothetical protein
MGRTFSVGYIYNIKHVDLIQMKRLILNILDCLETTQMDKSDENLLVFDPSALKSRFS